MSAKRSRKAPETGKHEKKAGKHGKHEQTGFDEKGEPAASGPSKARLLLKVGTGGLAVIRAVKRVRHTTGRADKLLAADSLAGLLPMVTAVAIVLRQLRRKQSSAHATP